MNDQEFELRNVLLADRDQTAEMPADTVIISARQSTLLQVDDPKWMVCPPKGPQDLRVYATLHAISRATGGMIGSDGRVLTVNPDARMVVQHDDAIIGAMLDEKMGLLESVNHQTIRLTDKGRYWLERFYKTNRLVFGRFR